VGHVGPSSRRTLRVGLDASIEDVAAAAAKHIDEVVTSYRIPAGLEARFQWLASGDVEVKQQLLNYLRELEKTEVVRAVRLQIPVLLDHLKSADGQLTHRLAQIAKIGKHELEILLDRNAVGVHLEEAPQPIAVYSQSRGSAWPTVWVVVAGIVIFLLWLHGVRHY
jgi:hypothetical protein